MAIDTAYPPTSETSGADLIRTGGGACYTEIDEAQGAADDADYMESAPEGSSQDEVRLAFSPGIVQSVKAVGVFLRWRAIADDSVPQVQVAIRVVVWLGGSAYLLMLLGVSDSPHVWHETANDLNERVFSAAEFNAATVRVKMPHDAAAVPAQVSQLLLYHTGLISQAGNRLRLPFTPFTPAGRG